MNIRTETRFFFIRWTSTLPRTVDYDAFLATGDDFFVWPTLDENAPMGLCYTSGTTGKPKGVCYSHRSTYLHTLASCMPDALGLTGVDVVLPVVPMFHAMAWGVRTPLFCIYYSFYLLYYFV